MTTLVLNYSTNLLDSIKGIFTAIFIGWCNARQRQANFETARIMLQHAKSDYPGYSVESLSRELDKKCGLV